MSTAVASRKAGPVPAGQVVNVPIDLVVPSDHQPRFMANPQAMAELIDSIRARGIRVPLLGRPHPKFAGTKPEMVELASGHRRLAAARQLDLGEVPMIVQEMDDREFGEVMVLENADRQNLHPLEEGRAIAELRRVGWSIEEIAARFVRSPTWVARRSALDDLIEPICELVKLPRANTIEFDWCDLSPLVLESLARLPAETPCGGTADTRSGCLNA